MRLSPRSEPVQQRTAALHNHSSIAAQLLSRYPDKLGDAVASITQPGGLIKMTLVCGFSVPTSKFYRYLL